MHIVYIIVPGGGPETFVRCVAPFLIASGHRVSVIVHTIPRKEPAPFPPEVSVTLIPSGHFSHIPYFLHKIIGEFRAWPIRLVSLGMTWQAYRAVCRLEKEAPVSIVEIIEGLPLIFFKRRWKVVVRAHGSDWTFKHFCREPAFKSAPYLIASEAAQLRAADSVVSISEHLAEHLSEFCRFPRARIGVAPYPIDIERFRPADAPASKPAIFSVGRLEKRKGTQLLLQAMERVWQSRPEVDVHFAGAETDFSHRQLLSGLPAGKAAQVFFAGFLSQEELAGYYRKMSFYVCPTQYETFGYTILEAMASGLAVVASRVGAIPELVEDGVTGILVDSGDAEGFARAILSLLQDQAMRERMGRAGREKAARYALKPAAARLLEAYGETLRRAPAPAERRQDLALAGVSLKGVDPASASVLDLGCGKGDNVLEAASQGARAYGMDLSPELLAKAKETALIRQAGHPPEFVLGSCEAVPYPSEAMDVVVCTELIEHTRNTTATLQEIRRVLKPGGHCIISFPAKYVENSIAFFHKPFLEYSGHVKQFSLAEMRAILHEHGFEISQTRRAFFEWSLYYLVRAMLGQIPSYDRRDDRYGIAMPEENKWAKFDYYYARLWHHAARAKIGLPFIWLGNFIFPKSYLLVCRKVGLRSRS